MENYLEIKTFLKRNLRFCFIDDKACSASSLFFKHRVMVKRSSVMQNPAEKYQIVFCTIRSQDRRNFLEALKELPIKMHLIGNTDYEENADRLIKYLKSDDDLMKRGKEGLA